MLGLDDSALEALHSLPPPGQVYVTRTFCAPPGDPSGALRRQVAKLARLSSDDVPWTNVVESATTSAASRTGGLGTALLALLAFLYVGNAAGAGLDESTTMADERRLDESTTMDESTTAADSPDTTSLAAPRGALQTAPVFALAAALGLAGRR